jgi:hypothetical protein
MGVMEFLIATDNYAKGCCRKEQREGNVKIDFESRR